LSVETVNGYALLSAAVVDGEGSIGEQVGPGLGVDQEFVPLQNEDPDRLLGSQVLQERQADVVQVRHTV